jgi:integrase
VVKSAFSVLQGHFLKSGCDSAVTGLCDALLLSQKLLSSTINTTMAKLSYVLRGAGGDGAKRTVVVRFTHNSKTFDKGTEAKVAEKDFDQDAGLVKIKVKGSADENKKIDAVRSRFHETLKRLEAHQLEPTVANFRLKYGELMTQLDSFVRNESKYALLRELSIDDVRMEIRQLEEQLEEKRNKLHSLLHPNENVDQRLFSETFKQYIKFSRANKLAYNTKANWEKTQRLIERQLPGVRVEDVNLLMLHDLRDRLVAKPLRNSSIYEHFIRIKAALRHFAKHRDKTLDLEYLKDVEIGTIVNDKPVIFLQPAELDALFDLPLKSLRLQHVRDRFLLSCYTGLRHVDLHFSEDSVTGDDYIHIFAAKTQRAFSVPYLERAKELMERLKLNPYKYDKQWVGNFSADIKQLCQKLDIFQVEKPISLKPDSERKPRWKMISSKAGRKTFINICMVNGTPIDVVAKWVGHASIDMINDHYKDYRGISDVERDRLNQGFQRKGIIPMPPVSV